MFINMQWIICLLLVFLPSICFAVEVTATPSSVTEGASFTLTCSVKENNSTLAQFTYLNNSEVGRVQLLGGVCVNPRRSQVCDQQCSCTTDGKSFSVTISNVTRAWDRLLVSCYVYNPRLAVSDFITISVINKPPDSSSSLITSTFSTNSGNMEIVPESVAQGTYTGVVLISIGGGMILLGLLLLIVAVYTLNRPEQQQNEDLSSDKGGNRAVYDEVTGSSQGNHGDMSGEASKAYELLQRRPDGKDYEDLSPKSGTGQNSTYVNASLH